MSALLERFTAHRGALLVVDMQEKLLAKIPDARRVIANCARLIQGAEALGLPAYATEQYPHGLGPTHAELSALLPVRYPKQSFHCCGVPEIVEHLHGAGRRIAHLTVIGIEAHVCVAQTVLELLNMGFRVQVPADAVASRNTIDWEFALRRLERAGAVVTTSEAALFEWTETADHPQFKFISALVTKHAVP